MNNSTPDAQCPTELDYPVPRGEGSTIRLPNPDPSPQNENGRRAADFFRQRGLERVVDAARTAFWRNGGPTGKLIVADATDAEHSGLAALSGRQVGHGALGVKLADLDDWLRRSGFACSLEALLAAYLGEPPGSRSEERARVQHSVVERRVRWQRAFSEITETLPVDAMGRRWLLDGAHGIAWLLRRFQNAPLASLAEKRDLVQAVARALSRLPLQEPRRLAAFANDLAGNPHAFDPDQEAGRLLLYGLLDLFGSETGIETMAGERFSAADRRALFERVGLLSETVSSTVVVFNLAGATDPNGAPDPRLAGPPFVEVLPLRRLLTWGSVSVSSADVFLVENPVVFEDLADALEPIANDVAIPTLVCTAGWLNAAAWRLLDLCLASDAAARFWYSGDFDLAGLRIAASLAARYPDNFRPWRLGASDYRMALREAGTIASRADLHQIASLAPIFSDLVDAIQETGRWAYQEALTAPLLEDLRAARYNALAETAPG